MNNDCLEGIVRSQGFGSLDDFVKANLSYLPREKRLLFFRLIYSRANYVVSERGVPYG